MYIAEVEAKLVAACERAIAEGARIDEGVWGVFNNGKVWQATPKSNGPCHCVIGALVLGSPSTESRIGIAARILGVPVSFIGGIIGGFDADSGPDSEAYQLGARLRARYVTP